MSRRGWVLFVAMAVVWGIPYLLIKVAVDEIAPATLVLARTVVATVLLLPVALARGLVRPLLPRWRPLLLARFGPERERLGGRRLLGLLVGLAGVAALVGFEVGAGDAKAIAAIAVVVVCYAVGPFILARTLADLPALGVVAASLALSALAYVPAGVIEAPASWPSGKAILAVVVLAVVCTAVAFLVFFELIAEVGAARSTVITYVNPAVAVLLGVLILDESFTLATAAGFALILVGSVLATSRKRVAAPEPAEPVVPVAQRDEVACAALPRTAPTP